MSSMEDSWLSLSSGIYSEPKIDERHAGFVHKKKIREFELITDFK